MLFTIPYALITSAMMAILAWPIAKIASTKFNIMDIPNQRKIHSIPTPRTGSILIFIGFVLGIVLFRSYLYSDLFVLTTFTGLIFTLGLIEDKYSMKASKRLLLQMIIVYFYVAYTGTTIKSLGHLLNVPEIARVPFTVFAIVGAINAFNLIDGLNGLASGLGIISLVSIAALSLFYNDTELSLLSAIFVGSIAGFMVLNMSGKVFMGDAGSYMIGFMIAVLSIRLINRNPEISAFSPFLISFIPVFDTIFAAYRRMRVKRHPFKADKRHLHHILRRRYHSDSKAVGTILFMQGMIAIIAIVFHMRPALLFGITALTSAFLIQLYIKKRHVL